MALVVFTIFGQGRLHQWTFLLKDKEGYSYLLDERSLRQEQQPAACTFLLKRVRDGQVSEARFRLDFQACTLAKGTEPPLAIKPGTVAEELRRELAQRRNAP